MKQFSKELGKVSITPKGDWNSSIANEKLDIVYDRRNNQAYIAKQDVPIGVDIDNREYWQPLNATGYADNNFINLTAENENGTITAYESLEEAVATIFPINRRVGATLSFYNLNADRLDRQAEFELWQFNSTDLANWENRDYWNNIYYNWNVFAGWYIDADALNNHVETPNVGQYAYVGSNLNDAILYQCRTNGTWTNTGIKVRNYISVVVSGNITIGENGNWFSNGEDTGIPATPAVDEEFDNIITKLESLSRTVQSIAITGGANTATNVTYNNDTSGLNAENAQDAIDELAVKNKEQDIAIGTKAEKSEVATKLDKKFDKENIAQEFGYSKDKVVSQSALPFRYIQSEEFIFAKVDANDKLLFGIEWDGTPKFGKTSAVEDRLQEQVNLLADKITAILGDDDATSAIDTLKELKDFFTSIDNTQTLTRILANLNSVSTKLGKDIKNLQDTKVDKEEGKSLIDSDVADANSTLEDPEGRFCIVTDADSKVLSYRDKNGRLHEEKIVLNKVYDKTGKKINLATTEDIPRPIDIELSELDGVQEHYVENLFKKGQIRTYDSDFANKVFAAIGRKTGSTGCYSNNIECKEGDWFTRSDFGTGIVVVLDENENILGDVANAAYKPTIQIVPSRPSYDFSKAKYVVFVVMLANINSEKIVKGKYIPTEEGDYMTIPRLRIMTSNIGKDMVTYIKSNTGKFYQLQINDSDGAPSIVPIQLQGIPASELPSNFPTFKVTGDFSKYYSGLVLSPIDGVAGYIYEIAPDGLVKRYLNTTAICPRIIKENETLYYYGVNGSPNYSSGKLNIYKAKDNTFELVKGNLGGGEDGSLLLEPHDCLVISVSPLHYIYQRYVENQITNVNSEQKRIIALHVGEIYDGTLLYEWHSEDYPELWTDSHSNGDNGDYLHNNTISIDSSGNLYLNNKHANQILVIKRTWNSSEHTASIGEILWKIGGNRTKAGWDVPTRIKTTTEQQWFESHDGTINSNGLITMFDNRASSPSRILEFKIDTSNKLLSDFKSYTYKQYHGRFMGSAEKLDEGVYLVSWGSTRSDDTANAGIYDFKNNKALFEIKFDATGSSAYRIYGIPKE